MPTPDVNGNYANQVYLDVGVKYISCDNGFIANGGKSDAQTAQEYALRGCFYLPPNQALCVSETSCNWNVPRGYNCTTDRLNNGGFYCDQFRNDMYFSINLYSYDY